MGESSYVPLFQEALAGEPFWLLVGCVLVNRATWTVASSVHASIRGRWPTPFDLAAAPEADVRREVARLGLAARRARFLGSLARAWIARPPRTRSDVLGMPGCGPYAADSWALFVERRGDVRPTDRRLLEFMKHEGLGR